MVCSGYVERLVGMATVKGTPETAIAFDSELKVCGLGLGWWGAF